MKRPEQRDRTRGEQYLLSFFSGIGNRTSELGEVSVFFSREVSVKSDHTFSSRLSSREAVPTQEISYLVMGMGNTDERSAS